LDRVRGDAERGYLGASMAESMPSGLNAGATDTLSSGSSIDKKKNLELIDDYSDDQGK